MNYDSVHMLDDSTEYLHRTIDKLHEFMQFSYGNRPPKIIVDIFNHLVSSYDQLAWYDPENDNIVVTPEELERLRSGCDAVSISEPSCNCKLDSEGIVRHLPSCDLY